MFLYFLLMLPPSPSFYNLILIVSMGCVAAPAHTEAIPANTILNMGPSSLLFFIDYM